MATVEEFARLIFLPENAERRFERIAGDMVEAISTHQASVVGANFAALILLHVKPHNLGRITSAKGYYCVGDDRYLPTMGFVSRSRQPKPCYDVFNPLSPDLAVEVLSPLTNESKTRFKIVNYLRAGTTVWVVDPDKRTIEVYEPGQSPYTVGEGDVLSGGAVLPGFTLDVDDVFED